MLMHRTIKSFLKLSKRTWSARIRPRSYRKIVKEKLQNIMPAFDITGSVDVRKVIRVQKIKQYMIHEESCTLQKRPYVCVLITALVCWLRTRECRYMQLMQKVQCILGPEFGSEERKTIVGAEIAAAQVWDARMRWTVEEKGIFPIKIRLRVMWTLMENLTAFGI